MLVHYHPFLKNKATSLGTTQVEHSVMSKSLYNIFILKEVTTDNHPINRDISILINSCSI